MTDTACQISPIDGECATHLGQECNTRPLAPAPIRAADDEPRLYDLHIFGWAWQGDGHQRRA